MILNYKGKGQTARAVPKPRCQSQYTNIRTQHAPTTRRLTQTHENIYNYTQRNTLGRVHETMMYDMRMLPYVGIR